MARTLEERFWEKVEIQGSDECWLWTSTKMNRGYGLIHVHGKNSLAHRVSWNLAHGEIPDGMCVCHTCDEPLCVNSRHLFLGTQAENLADMRRKGRAGGPFGNTHPRAKLTGSQVIEIRERCAAGEMQSDLAVVFGVARPTIWGIVHHKRWKHVEGGVRRNYVRIGSANLQSKLVETQVLEIRSRYAAGGVTQRALAAEFGVSQKVVCDIIHCRIWKHV